MTTRGMGITVGRGRASVRGTFLEFPPDSDPVAALREALSGLQPGRDLWWSASRWENDSRAQDGTWLSGCCFGVDVDHKQVVVEDGRKKLRKVPLSAELRARIAEVADRIPGNLIHLTPHGLRVIFVLAETTANLESWKSGGDGANTLMEQALRDLELPRPSTSAPGLVVDGKVTTDARRLLFAPNAIVDGVQRKGRVHAIRTAAYTLAELRAAAQPTPTRQRGVAERPSLPEAVESFNRDHRAEWPALPGPCPACGHNGCFHGLPDDPTRWFCFSDDHPNGCGRPSEKGNGHWGDALDLAAHAAGCTRREHLIAEGYLRDDARPITAARARAPGLTPVRIPGEHDDETGRHLEIQEYEFARNVVDAIPQGRVYRRGDLVGELLGPPGRRRFGAIEPAAMRNLVSEYCRLHQTKIVEVGEATQFRDKWKPASPSLVALALEEALRSDLIRELVRISTHPVFDGPDLTMLTGGWNADSGTFVDVSPHIRGVAPRVLELDEVRRELLDLLVDFPFADDASRENFIGLLLTPLVRPHIDGNVPFHLIEASLERTGKTKLAEQVLGHIILGQPTPAIQIGRRDEEIEKRITAMLLEGASILHVDNIGQHLDSPSLASLLTARIWSGRVLGQSRIVRVQNELTLVGSGNNVSVSGEIAKRTVLIRLQPRDDRPELRADFVHADLDQFLRESRARILGLLLGMVETWKQAGRPRGPRRLGGFERWASTVGGILQLHGFNDWLKNHRTWIRRAAPDDVDREILVAEWAKLDNPGHGRTAGHLLEVVRQNQILPAILERPDTGQAAALGRVLRKLVDRPIGRHVVRGQPRGNGSIYYLEPIGDAVGGQRGGSGGSGGFRGPPESNISADRSRRASTPCDLRTTEIHEKEDSAR